jgi:hypothetical protein
LLLDSRHVFTLMTVLKAVAAFLAGAISPEIEFFTGYKVYTMVVSGILFAIIWLIIASNWVRSLTPCILLELTCNRRKIMENLIHLISEKDLQHAV